MFAIDRERLLDTETLVGAARHDDNLRGRLTVVVVTELLLLLLLLLLLPPSPLLLLLSPLFPSPFAFLEDVFDFHTALSLYASSSLVALSLS